MTRPERHAKISQPGEPGAQQRSGAERLGEHALAAADEGGLAEPGAPRAQRRRVEAGDRGGERIPRRTIPFAEAVERFGMREVQAAAPGQQELAAWRAHLVVERDRDAGGGQVLCRNQPGWTGADDCGATRYASPSSCRDFAEPAHLAWVDAAP